MSRSTQPPFEIESTSNEVESNPFSTLKARREVFQRELFPKRANLVMFSLSGHVLKGTGLSSKLTSCVFKASLRIIQRIATLLSPIICIRRVRFIFHRLVGVVVE